MILPTIMTAPAAYVPAINAVFAAMGLGEDTLSVALVSAADDEATAETPATYYYAQDMGADAANVAVWNAMCEGLLPALPEGVAWGENGVISEAEAIAALTGHLTVASEAGLTTPEQREEFLAGILIGKGLKRRPEGEAM